MLGLHISEKESFDYLSVRVNHSLNAFLPKTVPLESRQYEEISREKSLGFANIVGIKEI